MQEVLLVLRSTSLLCELAQRICIKRQLTTKTFYSYTLARKQLGKKKYDVVVILDDDLDENCLQFLEYLNIEQYPTRVFFLSICCREAHQKLLALESGADDCLGLPCVAQELSLRFNKLLYMQKMHPEEKLEVDGITLYPQRGSVEKQGKRLPLRKKEFLILYHLFRYKNRVVTREMLSEYIWSEKTPSWATIDSYIRRIRILLGDKSKILQTVWGFGYTVVEEIGR